MKRIYVSLFLSSVLTYSLCACGAADTAPTDSETSETSGTDTDASTDGQNGTDNNQTDAGGTQNGTDENQNGTDNNQNDSDNTSDGADNTNNTDNSDATCDRSGFTEGTKKSARAGSGGWQFEAADEGGSAFINVASFVNWQGPTVPGTYTLTGINYKDCGLCLMAGTNCVNGSCDKLFYAHEGTVEVTSAGLENGTVISGTLRNVVFEEVTIADDFTTTTVPGGKTWCFENYGFNEVSVDPNAPEVVEPSTSTSESCVTGGNGTGVGNNIDNLQLTNCNNEVISLHDHCGTSNAVWYVHTAGWCTACDFWLPRVEALYQQETSNGLEVYYVLGQDTQGEAPTAEYCTQYAQAKGLDPARVLMDNGADDAWGISQQSIDLYEYGYIPWNGILRGSNMEYIWSDNVSYGVITGLEPALEEALGKDVDFTVMLQE